MVDNTNLTSTDAIREGLLSCCTGLTTERHREAIGFPIGSAGGPTGSEGFAVTLLSDWLREEGAYSGSVRVPAFGMCYASPLFLQLLFDCKLVLRYRT